MSMSDLKFTEEQLAAKSITALDDRPDLSADELKERLDSCDIREAYNGLIDQVETELGEYQDTLMVFQTMNLGAVISAMERIGKTQRFFAFFLDTGEIFCGTAVELQQKIVGL